MKLQGYVDADYARDLDQWRSMMGYVFTIAETSLVEKRSCKIWLLFKIRGRIYGCT